MPHDPLVIRWWRDATWMDVLVAVEVLDGDGRNWGSASVKGVKMGTYPESIDRETGAVEVRVHRPLTDPEGPVSGLIDSAMRMAQRALVDHANAAPVILGPPPPGSAS